MHGTGWWMTFAALLVLYLAAIGASFVLGLVPFIGSLAAAIVVYPFMLTYITSMYFRARGEGALVDAAIVPAGSWQPAGDAAAVADGDAVHAAGGAPGPAGRSPGRRPGRRARRYAAGAPAADAGAGT